MSETGYEGDQQSQAPSAFVDRHGNHLQPPGRREKKSPGTRVVDAVIAVEAAGKKVMDARRAHKAKVTQRRREAVGAARRSQAENGGSLLPDKYSSRKGRVLQPVS